MSTTHQCNAYCGDGLHCDLVWTSPATDDKAEWGIRSSFGCYRGRKVQRVEPAPEDPDMATLPPEMLDSIMGQARW